MIEFLLTIASIVIGVALFLYVNKRLSNRANKRLTMMIASSYFAFGLLCMLVSFFIISSQNTPPSRNVVSREGMNANTIILLVLIC